MMLHLIWLNLSQKKYLCLQLSGIKLSPQLSPIEWEENSYITDFDIVKIPFKICKYMIVTAECGMGKSMYLIIRNALCFL